jgi:hypothetical protein
MALGVWLLPFIALATLVRRGRVFHPGGTTWRGEAAPVATDGPAAKTAARLSGPFTMRISGGSHHEIRDDRRDVLGCTVRLSRAGEPDQDLLFASFRWISAIKDGERTTDQRDVLRNMFHTASWSRDPDLGVVTFRLVPTPRDSGEGPDVAARLDRAIQHGGVSFALSASPDGETWTELSAFRLTGRAEVDDRATSFSPWNAGRGVVPTGFINGIRRIVYPVGRALR